MSDGLDKGPRIVEGKNSGEPAKTKVPIRISVVPEGGAFENLVNRATGQKSGSSRRVSVMICGMEKLEPSGELLDRAIGMTVAQTAELLEGILRKKVFPTSPLKLTHGVVDNMLTEFNRIVLQQQTIQEIYENAVEKHGQSEAEEMAELLTGEAVEFNSEEEARKRVRDLADLISQFSTVLRLTD